MVVMVAGLEAQTTDGGKNGLTTSLVHSVVCKVGVDKLALTAGVNKEIRK